MQKNPVKSALSILFVGGAAVFVIVAFGNMQAEQLRLDTAAQTAGFADDDELKQAKAKGFSEAPPYREAAKREVEAQRAESARKAEIAAKAAEVAAKAKAVADADKKLRQARFEEGSAYAVAIKKGMKNPDSFKLESVRRTGEGIFCFEYRAANSFNAIIPGKALVGAGKAASSDQGNSFAPLWNKHCAGKPSEDFDTIVYAMKNGYL